MIPLSGDRFSPAIIRIFDAKSLIIVKMSEPTILYLDNNASTPLATPVLEAMLECARCQHGNPASPHLSGRKARQVVEKARERILVALGGRTTGTNPDRIIFTSGATEANNLALRGLGKAGPIIISSGEHPSVERVARSLMQSGTAVHWLDVDRQGVISLHQLESLLQKGAGLVSVIWAQHETGVLQPMQKIGELCQSYGVPLHTDATQIVNKMHIDLQKIPVSALTFSGHKFHGPKGVGGLFIRGSTDLKPLLLGGFQQSGTRPGTESPVLAEGLWAAWEWSQSQMRDGDHALCTMRDFLEHEISLVFPNVVFHGDQTLRTPQTSCFSVAGVDRQALLMSLDQAGIACSTGAACESGAVQRSPILEAMDCETSLLDAAIRLSVGYLNTNQEMELAAGRITKCLKNLQKTISSSNTAAPARREGLKMVD